MKFKSLAVAATFVMLAATPAFAARTTKHEPTFPVPQHLLMVPKLCDFNDWFNAGGFLRFTSTHGHQSATWGATTDGGFNVGVNVFPTGLPAKNFQVDWDLSNSNRPYFCTVITTTSGVEIWACGDGQKSGNINDPKHPLDPGFTFEMLPNGFTRFRFSAAVSGVPAGSTWNTIGLLDEFGESAGQDTITNMLVNGIPVSPDTHAPTNPPVTDCSD